MVHGLAYYSQELPCQFFCIHNNCEKPCYYCNFRTWNRSLAHWGFIKSLIITTTCLQVVYHDSSTRCHSSPCAFRMASCSGTYSSSTQLESLATIRTANLCQPRRTWLCEEWKWSSMVSRPRRTPARFNWHFLFPVMFVSPMGLTDRESFLGYLLLSR